PTIGSDPHVRAARPDTADLRARPRHAAILQLIDVDHRDAVLAMKVEVVLAVHRSADADLDESPAVDQPFFNGPPERCAVEIFSAEILVPGIDMRIELDEAERAGAPGERPERAQRNRVLH